MIARLEHVPKRSLASVARAQHDNGQISRPTNLKKQIRKHMKPTSEHITRARTNHLRALETLRAPSCKLSGLQLWRKLVKLEREVHDATTAQCNGTRYGSQPFRPDWNADGEESEITPWRNYLVGVNLRVSAIFGHVPVGFFVNGDARGMACKLDSEKVTIPEGMQTDWGGNGLLAAIIND